MDSLVAELHLRKSHGHTIEPQSPGDWSSFVFRFDRQRDACLGLRVCFGPWQTLKSLNNFKIGKSSTARKISLNSNKDFLKYQSAACLVDSLRATSLLQC